MHPAVERSWRTRTSIVRGAGSGTAMVRIEGAGDNAELTRDRANTMPEPGGTVGPPRLALHGVLIEPASSRRPAHPAVGPRRPRCVGPRLLRAATGSGRAEPAR